MKYEKLLRRLQEGGDAQVLVDIGPVDAFAIAKKFEMSALGRSGMEKTRKPSERNRNGAAVRNRHDELAISGQQPGAPSLRLDIRSRFTRGTCRRARRRSIF